MILHPFAESYSI